LKKGENVIVRNIDDEITCRAVPKGKVAAEFVYRKEEDYRVLSPKCRDFGVYSMSKRAVNEKCSVNRAHGASCFPFFGCTVNSF
jgi:hypothetical protein